MSKAPSGWEIIPLSQVIQTQKGKKPDGLGPKDDLRTVPYINIAAFESQKIGEFAPEQQIPRCEPNDTLLVWDGARAGLCGRGMSGYIGSTLARVTSDLSDPAYLYYFIHSNYSTLNTQTKGVGIPHINPAVLNSLEFPLAPLAEQTRIVEKLEELLSDLDAGVAELKAAQKKLTQYRQSLLKSAVEGALTAEWRKKIKPKETGAQLLECILKERRARWEEKQLDRFKELGKTPPKGWQDKYHEPVQPDTTNLPELPEGWVWASVEQISHTVADGVHKKPNYVPQGIPFVTVRNLTAGPGISFENIKYISQSDHLEFIKRTHPEPGDILISKDGTLGVTRVINTDVEFSIFVSVALVKPVFKQMSQFLGIAFVSPVVQKQMTPKGSGLVHIHLEDLRKDCIPLPSSLEQLEICNIVDTHLSEIESKEMSLEINFKQTAAQRKNILKSAFSGLLVPQDPNDEPADVLLARIQEERKKQAAQPKQRKAKVTKEISIVTRKLIDVLTEVGDWLPAQEAFRRCGIADGATTEQIEEIYAELRGLDKAKQVLIQPVLDDYARKQYDRLRLAAKG